MQENHRWVVYIIECGDGTFYTGITTDITRRQAEHKIGKGAKYTKSRGFKQVLYVEDGHSRSSALKREAEIKSFSKSRKLQLIKTS